MKNMEEILKQFLYKDISREIYYVPSNTNKKELDDILKQLKIRVIENGTFPTLTRKYHTIAGENLGKGIIIAFEFYGIEGALKFIRDVSIEAEEQLIKNNNKFLLDVLLKERKRSLKRLKGILKVGIMRIDKMLNEWE